MSIARTTLSFAGVVVAVATTLAIATLWLLLTEPVTVADAVAKGDVSPLMTALAGVLANAVRGLLDYL
jgi:energy-coupling factor transporter ATP-binding protein EcfA2